MKRIEDIKPVCIGGNFAETKKAYEDEIEQALIDSVKLIREEGGAPDCMFLPFPKGFGKFWNPQKQKWCKSTRSKKRREPPLIQLLGNVFKTPRNK